MRDEFRAQDYRCRPAEDGNKTASENTLSPLAKCWKFLGDRKRIWLPPVVVVTLLLLGAVLLAKGPAIVPFVYRNL